MSHGRDSASKPYGVLAEFETSEQLLEVARAAKDAGYEKMDAYSPIPVHGLAEILGHKDERLHWFVFAAGVMGALAGLGIQAWISTVDYPWNVGGRPFFSLPSFVPVTFEATVLFAAGAATVLLFALSGLPKPHHPIFNGSAFHRASQDRYFLCIEADDAKYGEASATEFLESFGPNSIEPIYTSEGY